MLTALPESVAAGDHLIAILELHQTAIHLAARQHETGLAFASMPVPAEDVDVPLIMLLVLIRNGDRFLATLGRTGGARCETTPFSLNQESRRWNRPRRGTSAIRPNPHLLSVRT